MTIKCFKDEKFVKVATATYCKSYKGWRDTEAVCFEACNFVPEI